MEMSVLKLFCFSILVTLLASVAWGLPTQTLKLEDNSSAIQQLFRNLVAQVQKLIAEFLIEFRNLSGQ